MFVVDAFISNNDRNEGNWGVIFDKKSKLIRISPVYDNGASFYNKTPNTKFENFLEDEVKFRQVVYDSSVSIFKEFDKKINPLKYIESKKKKECNAAILRIVPKINLEKLKDIIKELPEEVDGISVLNSHQKEFYIKILEYRYEKIFLPVYQKLMERDEKLF